MSIKVFELIITQNSHLSDRTDWQWCSWPRCIYGNEFMETKGCGFEPNETFWNCFELNGLIFALETGFLSTVSSCWRVYLALFVGPWHLLLTCDLKAAYLELYKGKQLQNCLSCKFPLSVFRIFCYMLYAYIYIYDEKMVISWFYLFSLSLRCSSASIAS